MLATRIQTWPAFSLHAIPNAPALPSPQLARKVCFNYAEGAEHFWSVTQNLWEVKLYTYQNAHYIYNQKIIVYCT